MSLNTSSSDINFKAIGLGVIIKVGIEVRVIIAIAFSYIIALKIDIIKGAILLYYLIRSINL